MAKTAPSAATVERMRYVLRFVIRAVVVALLIWAGTDLAATLVSHAISYVHSVGITFIELMLQAAYNWFFDNGVSALAGIAVLLLQDRIVRWVAPMPRPVCPNCEYPLQAEAAKCPECGAGVG